MQPLVVFGSWTLFSSFLLLCFAVSDSYYGAIMAQGQTRESVKMALDTLRTNKLRRA